MKKINFKKLIAVIMCVVMTATGLCLPSSAAAAGTTMNNPISVSFGKKYSKKWTKKTRNTNCFNKIKISNRGILTITTDRPYDSKGEILDLEFKLYDSDGDIVRANGTNHSSESADSKYRKYVGLDKGTYYLNITPDSWIISGTFMLSYSFSFKKSKRCEIESNESTSKATELQIGKCIPHTLAATEREVKNTLSGYQVRYSRNADFSDAVTEYHKVDDDLYIEPFMPTGTHYIRVRAYRETEKKTVYSPWSDTYRVDY